MHWLGVVPIIWKKNSEKKCYGIAKSDLNAE